MKKQGEKDSMRIKIVMFWVQGAVVERERERERGKKGRNRRGSGMEEITVIHVIGKTIDRRHRR